MQIVIAKVEMTALRATGRTITRDRNYFPEFESAPEAKGCMWLGEGTDADVAKARAEMTEYKVYTFPASEKDPIGKAKAMALEAFKVKGKRATPLGRYS